MKDKEKDLARSTFSGDTVAPRRTTEDVPPTAPERAQHTPGPWIVKRARIPVDGEYDYAIYTDVGKQIVAEAFGRSDTTVYHNAEANARLIAAAPELLEACKVAKQYCESGCVEQTNSHLSDLLDDVIAKAEGR